MKELLFTIIILFSVCGIAQDNSHYKKISKYDVYNKDWAMVKTMTNSYGFIDKSGKEVVPPIYSKIYKFEGNFALVKNISGAYGFIDKSAKLVIPSIYYKKWDANQQLKLLLKK